LYSELLYSGINLISQALSKLQRRFQGRLHGLPGSDRFIWAVPCLEEKTQRPFAYYGRRQEQRIDAWIKERAGREWNNIEEPLKSGVNKNGKRAVETLTQI
jgi:hypothetical protein